MRHKTYRDVPPAIETYLKAHYATQTASEMGDVLGMNHHKVRDYIRDLKLVKNKPRDEVASVSELMSVNPDGLFVHDPKLFTI